MQLEYSYDFNSGSLDSGWGTVDATGYAGASVSVVSQALRLVGGGDDVYTVDMDDYLAHYRQTKTHGDFDVIIRVLSQTNPGSDWSKAGIMIRNNIQQPASSNGYCILAVTPNAGFAFQWDNTGDGILDSNTNTGTVVPTLPAYLKVSRRGYTFTGYQSADKTSWTQVGTAVLSTAQAGVDVGIFNCSHMGSTTNTTTFDDLEIYTGKGRFFAFM